MCTYNFSFNDSLMECMRRAFPNEEAAREWLQRQMNGLIVDFVAKQEKNSEKGSMSAKDLYGIWDNDGLTSDEAVNELKNLRTFSKTHRLTEYQ